jgi:hypothetical protein
MAIPIRKITDFKGQLTGGGSRPNLFEVEMAFPTDVGVDPATLTKGRFLCKAAQLPASNVSSIDVPFRGRILKVAGDRTFDPWTITIINDVDFKLRHSFEKWMNYLSKLDNNTGYTDPASYQTDMIVYQLGRDGAGTGKSAATGNVSILRSAKLFGTFPTTVSALDLSYESTDTISEFTVDLQVQYFELNDGPGALQ